MTGVTRMSHDSGTVENLMSGMVFYRQKRFDGGIRTGVELGQETILEHFEVGSEDRDPRLLWYLDVRCQGPGVPTDVESARHWFLETASIIKGGLTRFADESRRVGVDKDSYPLEWSDFPSGDDGVNRKLVCSLAQRMDGRDLAEIVDDVSRHWSERLESMIAEQIEYSARG